MNEASSGSTVKTALFLFAHQDDEFAAAPQILDFVRTGTTCRFLYLTNGDGHGCDPAVRDGESAAALASLGIDRSTIDFLGSREGIRDGTLFRHLDRVYDLVLERAGGFSFDSVHSLAWEGGHHDHDAAHLIALALAQELSRPASFFPLYNGYRRSGKFFRVMTTLPGQVVERLPISLSDGIRTVLLARHYGSQWKLWLRLLPEAAIGLIGVRRLSRIRPDRAAVLRPPHPGAPLYERTLNVSWCEFADVSAPFVMRRISQERANAISEDEGSPGSHPA